MSGPIVSVRGVILHVAATAFVQLIRAKPLVMVVFWFFIPIALGVALPQYWVARIAVVGFEAASLGETIRAGIQPVPRAGLEAASATGLRYGQTTRAWVVLPQATRNMLPLLATQFIILFKGTSLAAIIGSMDLTKDAQGVNQREIRPSELRAGGLLGVYLRDVACEPGPQAAAVPSRGAPDSGHPPALYLDRDGRPPVRCGG